MPSDNPGQHPAYTHTSFNCPSALAKLLPSEVVVYTSPSPVTLQAPTSPPTSGTLTITNLRVLVTLAAANASIPLANIISATHAADTTTLTLLDRDDAFNTAPQAVLAHITNTDKITRVLARFRETRAYRCLVSRSRDLCSSATGLHVLPGESILEAIDGVCNVSMDAGTIGRCLVTNCRLVWMAAHDAGFNVSAGWACVSDIVVQKSRYGLAMCVEVVDLAAGVGCQSRQLKLGFKIDPREVLVKVAKLAKMCLKTWTRKPVWGFDAVALLHEGADGSVDMMEEMQFQFPRLTAGKKVGNGHIDGRLGLAVDRSRIMFSVHDSWRLDVSSSLACL
ncbi:MAG: hypothetical protein SGCHY_003441 [Lobulomycetales sp.]